MEATSQGIIANFKLLILIVWIGRFLSAPTVYSQQPIHYFINTENGLPDNEVYDLIEDRFGFIWLGCDKGIYRYDGIRFKELPIRQDLNQAMTALSLDLHGRIWGKNAAGQVFLHVADSMCPVYLGIDNQKCRSALATDGNFYTLTGSSIQQRGANGRVLRDFNLNWVRDSMISVGFFDVKGSSIFTHLGPGGLSHTDLGSAQSAPMEIPLTHADHSPVAGMNLHGETPLFLLPSNGKAPGAVFKREGEKLERILEIPSGATGLRWLRIWPEGDSSVWLCSSQGALRATPGQSMSLPKFILPDCQVSSVLQDREGNTWFATLNKGLVVVPNLQAQKAAMTTAGGGNEHFTAINSLSDGSILAGTYTGKLWISRNGEPFVPVLEQHPGRIGAVKRIIEHDGKVYVLRNEVAISLDGAQSFRTAGQFNARDMAIFDGKLHLITENGLISVELDQDNNIRSLHYLIHAGGWAIGLEKGGSTAYVGFHEGAKILHDGLLTDIILDGKHVVACEMSVSDDGVWMATWGHGLICMRNGKVVKRYNESDGLPQGRLLGVVAVGRHVFFRSKRHLGKVDSETSKVEVVSHGSGFNPGEIKQFCVVEDRMFLATNQGIASLPTSFSTYTASRPRIRIDAMRSGNQLFPPVTKPELPYGQSIQIDFTGLHYRSKGGLKYKYRLVELDTAWIETGGSANYAIWNTLPSGHFRFEVKALGALGEESEHVATMSFTILKPFFLRAWFLLLASCSLVGLTLLVFRVALLRVRKRAAIQSALISSQLTALKAQMNPHFLFNSLNSIQHFILQQDIRNSNLYLNKFSNLVRKVLEASGHDWIELETEMEILQLYLDLEKLRFGNDFRFEIRVIPSDASCQIRIPSMVIQPFVENAVKHGLLHKKGSKFLNITFLVREVMECTIEDDGIGRKRSAEINARKNRGHDSFSTDATRRRLDLIRELYHSEMGLEIIDLNSDDVPAGTKVVLTLPIRQN